MTNNKNNLNEEKKGVSTLQHLLNAKVESQGE